MTQSYPLTKTELYRFFTQTQLTQGSNGVGKCDIAVTKTPRVLVRVNSVVLGASPPGWRQLIRRGHAAGSLLSGVRYRIKSQGPGFIQLWDIPRGPCDIRILEGDIQLTAGDFVPVSVNMDSDALAKARKRILEQYLGAKKRWRGGNFLAEFAETVHMIRHPVQSLFGSCFTFAEEVRRIKRLAHNARQYAKLLGDLWLAFKFGVEPLLGDIVDANQAMKKLESGTGHDVYPINSSGSVESVVTFAGSDAPSSPLGGINAKRDLLQISKRTVRFKGALSARPESFATIADNFGVALGDALPAVWEAIPWSFFVDYFVNVQEVVDSWQMARADFAWLNQTYRNVTEARYSPYYQSPLPPTRGGVCSVPGVSFFATYVNRSTAADIYPDWRFRIPGVGSTKWYNIAALAASIQSSRPSRS